MPIEEWEEVIIDLENTIVKELSPTFTLSKRMHGARKMVTELIFYHEKEKYYIAVGFMKTVGKENFCRIQIIKRQKYGRNEKLKMVFIDINNKEEIFKTIRSYKIEIELKELFKIQRI
jgi:hypothetical protein